MRPTSVHYVQIPSRRPLAAPSGYCLLLLAECLGSDKRLDVLAVILTHILVEDGDSSRGEQDAAAAGVCRYQTFFTGGIVQEPSMIEGLLSFGQ